MIIYSWFTHWKWWFSIVMLVYQRVAYVHLNSPSVSNPISAGRDQLMKLVAAINSAVSHIAPCSRAPDQPQSDIPWIIIIVLVVLTNRMAIVGRSCPIFVSLLSNGVWPFNGSNSSYPVQLVMVLRAPVAPPRSWIEPLWNIDIVVTPEPKHIYIYICMHLSIYLSIYVCIYLSVCLSIYLSMYICMYVSINLSIYLPTYLSIYLTIYSILI